MFKKNLFILCLVITSFAIKTSIYSDCIANSSCVTSSGICTTSCKICGGTNQPGKQLVIQNHKSIIENRSTIEITNKNKQYIIVFLIRNTNRLEQLDDQFINQLKIELDNLITKYEKNK